MGKCTLLTDSDSEVDQNNRYQSQAQQIKDSYINIKFICTPTQTRIREITEADVDILFGIHIKKDI